MKQGQKVSDDHAWTVIRLLKHFSPLEVSSLTDLNVKTINTLSDRYFMTRNPTNQVEGKKRGRKRLLDGEDIDYLHGSIERTNDIFLDELQAELEEICGKQASQSTIWRALERSGFTMKKITSVAYERSQELRAEYILRISNYSCNQLVFVDESACDRRTTFRNRAWAISGEKAIRKTFFVRGKRYSILPALSLSGILHVNILEGSFNTASFATFIEGLLDQMQPYPEPNSVIVMDNCRIHKCPEVLKMITDRGMKVEFLPPYSPDYNPIELAFSFIKNVIRRNGNLMRLAVLDEDESQIYMRLHEAVWSIKPEHAQAWYKHCGY